MAKNCLRPESVPLSLQDKAKKVIGPHNVTFSASK